MGTFNQTSALKRRDFVKGVGATAVLTGLGAVTIKEAVGAQPNPSLTHLSAAKLAELIATRQITAVAVINAHLKRIEEVNPKLNAIVQMDVDQIRSEARQADKDLSQGVNRGPLHGVPFTMKDSILTKGMITTNGCPELRSYVPNKDATVVKRLKEAGGILLGKTNVPEMCHHGVTDNIVYGRTNNPYDLERSPDGSSGGEAAIIAAGGSPFGLGTDIGGSIRNPSHVCGIAGLKPTSRRVPETGMLGAFPPFVAHWNGIGPMARHVEDLDLVLRIISGPDGRDPRAMPVSLSKPQDVQCKKLKIAYFTEDGYGEPTAETKAAVEKAVDVLRKSGATVIKDRPDCFKDAMDIWMPILIPSWAITTRYLQTEYARLGGSRVSEERLFLTEWMLKWLDFLYQSGDYEPEDHFRLQFALERYQQQMLAFVQSYDVLISPVLNKPAVPHPTPEEMDAIPFGEFWNVVKQDVGAFAMAYNLTGWPGAVVRAGTSPEGLPIGVQIAAKPWRDDVAIAVAAKIEEGLGGWRPPVNF
jgi:amidase